MVIKLLILASIGAIIGWTTNVIAIKLMFRPIEPINILGYKLQGLIPKRKAEIATNIGKTVEDELVSIEEIIDEFIEKIDKTEVLTKVKRVVYKIVDDKMPLLVPESIKQMIFMKIDEAIEENGEDLMVELSEELVHKASENIKLSNMVEKKILEFEFAKLEEIIISIAKKELKHIEVLGGVIGFFIGLVQGAIILMLQ